MSTHAVQWVAGGIRPGWTLSVVSSIEEPPGGERALAGLDDRGLVRACLAGRREAFDVLVERHQRGVYQLCYRFVRSHEDAADLTQDVFLRAYRGLHRFRGDAALSTWLYRIGVNICLNRVSSRASRESPLDEARPVAVAGADPVSALAEARRRERVRAAVGKLPRKQRAALILRVYHELSHQEIAAALGTSVGAAKANVFHALANLRRALAAEKW
jgi:RNA polymerase sigma-70 factor (ECF subfamily)